MSPPMTRAGSHGAVRAEHLLAAGQAPGWAQLDSGRSPGQASGRPRVTAPQGLEPGATTARGTRNGLAEAWDCSTFSSESLPAWAGRRRCSLPATLHFSYLLFVLMRFCSNLFSRHPL